MLLVNSRFGEPHSTTAARYEKRGTRREARQHDCVRELYPIDKFPVPIDDVIHRAAVNRRRLIGANPDVALGVRSSKSTRERRPVVREISGLDVYAPLCKR
jgi:hypothetical protein